MQFSTKAVHSGQTPDTETGAVVPPIYATSTYKQERPGVYEEYDYTRAGNPNFSNLERVLADLEQAQYATVFSSGTAALTALVSQLNSGEVVVTSDNVYGGTVRLFEQVFQKFNIQLELVDMTDVSLVENAIQKHKPAFVFIETPTNPLLKVADIKAVAALIRNTNSFLVVDNTFATPYFQQPLSLGADVVLHSTTKYINGHSDAIGGALITNDTAKKESYDFARKALGLNPSPFDVWLTHRGIKTLGIRMEQHAENAQAVARYLEQHPLVNKVYYPGLASHPQHEVARQQMLGYSGIVSVEFNLSYEQTMDLISSFSVFTLAESLGGVESLVDHPASMTHASLTREQRAEIGLSDGLVRLSVGIESVQDLIQDMEATLAAYAKTTTQEKVAA